MEITNLKMKKCLNGGDAYRRKSIGEQIVASILDDLNINYFYDVSCDNLKGVKNGTLRFDFCIPIDQNCKTLNECLSSNGKYIILEYNGIFHYHIIKGKTTKYTLTKQQMNDYINNYNDSGHYTAPQFTKINKVGYNDDLSNTENQRFRTAI